MDKKVMNNKGFTLLELLMVVIIIAILAAIALPQYIRATERARAAEAFSALGALRSAQMRFAGLSDANNYAATFDELDIEMQPLRYWIWPPAITTGASGPGIPPTGLAELTRIGGQFGGQVIGIQFGTGTICGSYVPHFGTVGGPACVAD